MNTLHRLCVLVLTGSIIFSGCRLHPKQHQFPALSQAAKNGNELVIQPVSHQTPKEKTGFVAKSKRIAGKTLAFVGAGFVMLVIAALTDDDDDEKSVFDPNPLWHQGYGYNNPNNERIKNGEPVLNFDGSVAK